MLYKYFYDLRFRYLLVRLKIYKAIYKHVNLRELEDMYQKLVEQPWEQDDEESFPFILKVEILNELFLNFDDFGHHLGIEQIINLYKYSSFKIAKDSENIWKTYWEIPRGLQSCHAVHWLLAKSRSWDEHF